MRSTTRPSVAVTTIVDDTAFAQTVPELAQLLRRLHRRDARRRGTKARTYRELAATTGWSHAMIAEYLRGTTLPPTDRFDQLIRLLGATAAERGQLARARDRVDELRRSRGEAGRSPSLVGRNAMPHELPARVPGFVGRRSALDSLDGLSIADRTSLVVAAICGGGGVGKTALAVHWAHQACDRFPDGQIYVDLSGYAATEPLDPGKALGRILHTLGVERHRIPADPDERANRYRSILFGRRMLVVLDNAVCADQVRPLLPGGSSCMVIVTSRSSLGGLVAADGAHRIDLDVLTDAEAWTLLRTLLGERVYAATEDVRALMALCGRLPLALRIAAELAQSHAEASIAELVDELHDHTARLDLLDTGDTRSAIRSVLSWSYHRLSTPAATLFRLLGCGHGPDLTLGAAASLAGVTPSGARRLLSELTRTHMVTEVAGGRFAVHQLLRTYAAERLRDNNSDELPVAVSRLVDHYLEASTRAARVLDPAMAPLGVAAVEGVTTTPIETVVEAHAWFASERLTLPVVSRLAHEHGLTERGRLLTQLVTAHRDAVPPFP